MPIPKREPTRLNKPRTDLPGRAVRKRKGVMK